MSISIDMANWPVSGVAVGLGIWSYFLWCWVTVAGGRRRPMIGAFGLVTAAAFVIGAGGSLLVGTLGLSSIGAMVGGVGALLLVTFAGEGKRLWPADHLVPGGIAGLSIARVGCLLEGCDFGRPAQWAPSVVYGDDTRAWAVHVAEHGLSVSSPTSLAVHPFAGYLAGWGLLAAGLGEWVRRRTSQPGRAAVYSAVAFLAGGGFIEWLREPATVVELTDGWSVYPMVYWVSAALVALGWWWRARSKREKSDE